MKEENLQYENVIGERDLIAKNCKVERRKYLRSHCININRYHVIRQENIHTGLSVDISKEGLGMITHFPLGIGNILVFEDEVEFRMSNISINAFITRWVGETEKNGYRVGLEFNRVGLEFIR